MIPTMQQIVTLVVPGTAMPAWGDRMTDADIQAIAGFVRQWEDTAPEVAVPVRPAGGGPPWLRNTSQTTTQGPARSPAGAPQDRVKGRARGGPKGQGQGQVMNQSGGEAVAQQMPWWQVIDWRSLLLAFGGFSIAFTFILAGYSALKR